MFIRLFSDIKIYTSREMGNLIFTINTVLHSIVILYSTEVDRENDRLVRLLNVSCVRGILPARRHRSVYMLYLCKNAMQKSDEASNKIHTEAAEPVPRTRD